MSRRGRPPTGLTTTAALSRSAARTERVSAGIDLANRGGSVLVPMMPIVRPVSGPITAPVDGDLAAFDGTTGQLVKTGGSTAALYTALLAIIYPVGSVYGPTTAAALPTEIAALGTWAVWAAGRVVVGIDSGDVDFDTVEETRGAKTVAASGSVAAPVFTGDPVAAASTAAAPDLVTFDVLATGVSPVTTATGTNSAPAFTGSATSVVQPSIVGRYWKRTA